MSFVSLKLCLVIILRDKYYKMKWRKTWNSNETKFNWNWIETETELIKKKEQVNNIELTFRKYNPWEKIINTSFY